MAVKKKKVIAGAFDICYSMQIGLINYIANKLQPVQSASRCKWLPITICSMS